MKFNHFLFNLRHKGFRTLLILFLLWPTIQLQAQFYSIGVDPPSVRWEIIESTHFKLIYPKEYGNEARKILSKLELLHPKIGQSISSSPRKTTLIIHNRTVVSNGVTSYAPKRVELFTFSSENCYSQFWMDQLIIHEMRHICQMDKINTATARWLYYLFGEQVIGGIVGLYIPTWFLEGDAVLRETTLSNSGRGRTPIFTAELRTNLLYRGADTYDQALFGSYKKWVANPYQQGFFIVKQAELQFGGDFWEKNLKSTALNPFIPNPFTRAFKKQAGTSIRTFYRNTMNLLRDQEMERIASSLLNPSLPLSPEGKEYADYSSFSVLNDSTVIALKRQLHKNKRLVAISNGIETTIAENALIVEGSISAQNDIAVWIEQKQHPRWDQSSWFSLISYHAPLRKRDVIVSKCRLQSPAISNDAAKIAAVNQSETDQWSLQILDFGGKIIYDISPPNHETLMQPQWCSNDTAVVAILLGKAGKQLAIYSLKSNQWRTISPPTTHDFLLWQVRGDRALLTASWSRNTPICQVSLGDGSCEIAALLPFDVTSARITPSNQLLCNQVTAYGNRLYKIAATIEKRAIPLFTSAQADEFTHLNPKDSLVDFSLAADSNWTAKPYRKLSHLLNIHSWGPISVAAGNQDLNPGISIASQNLLSSSFLNAGISHNLAEKSTTYYTDYSYKGWFAELSAGVQSAIRNNQSTTEPIVTWQQSEYDLQLRLPLLFQTPKFLIPLNISTTGSLINFSPTSSTPSNYIMGNLGSVSFRIYHGLLKRKPLQALQSPLGYTIELNHRMFGTGRKNTSRLSAGEITLFAPGLRKNQGIQLYGGIQVAERYENYYNTFLQAPRGYIGLINQNAITTSLNYRFPILYPEISLGSILYLKRLRGILFHDYLFLQTTSTPIEYSSVGAEIMTDTHWFRFIAPIAIGGRATYNMKNKSYSSEIIFSIDINSL